MQIMGDTNIPGIDLVDDDDTDGTTLDIGQGYVLSLRFLEEMIRFRIERKDNSDISYQDVFNRGFFKSRQKRSTISNEIAAQTTLSADFIKQRLREIRSFLESAERRTMAVDARKLLDRTQDIRAYKTPEELTVAVWVDAPEEALEDSLQRLEFSAAEFGSSSAEALKMKHMQAFIDRLRISDEDWETIRDAWLDDAKLEQSESQSEDDVIADRVTDVLSSRISARTYDDLDPLLNSDSAAYYESADNSEYDVATVWIQSVAIQQIIESESTKSPASYLSTLSQTLRRNDVTLDSSQRKRNDGSRFSLYPFAADEIGIDDLAVQTVDQDDDSDDDDDGKDIGIEQ